MQKFLLCFVCLGLMLSSLAACSNQKGTSSTDGKDKLPFTQGSSQPTEIGDNEIAVGDIGESSKSETPTGGTSGGTASDKNSNPDSTVESPTQNENSNPDTPSKENETESSNPSTPSTGSNTSSLVPDEEGFYPGKR